MSWAQNTKLRFQIAALIGTFGCPGFLIWMAPETKRQIASLDWPTAEGEITGVTVKDWRSKNSEETQYYGRAVYRYTVDEREYTSDLTDLGPGAKRSRPAAALADVAQYEPGMQVSVYYDPQEPSVGILTNGIPPIHLGLIIGLSAGTVVCLTVSILTIRSWRRGAQQAS